MKDVNQGLCDDSLVDTDKIGSGNFFWCVCVRHKSFVVVSCLFP